MLLAPWLLTMNGSDLMQMISCSFSEKKRGELWQEMEKVLGSYTSSHLVAALCAHTQDTVQTLEEQTTNIDIRKDTEKLRFAIFYVDVSK